VVYHLVNGCKFPAHSNRVCILSRVRDNALKN